ncbi:ADP-ribosylation factor-like protein 13A [Agelaius phoeniceus]|uniref:ADP-ribosylation factor-like protein 13A n=1 Tax=Agelaius phoeniceus TaxID=39638 RepID=UPI00405513E4
MFHLFSHCWSWLQAVQEPVRKVTLLVMGLDNAGKTSVIADIERGEERHSPEPAPGGGSSFSRLRVDRFEVTLRDLPGAQRSRSAWRSHYSEAHGLLFVLDSADLARMEEARKVLGRVLSHPDVSGKPLLLLANKQDAPAALLPCELIERLCLERLVNENRSPCRIEPCVAKRVPPAGPARTTLQGLRWLLRAAAAAPAPPDAAPVPPAPRAARGRPPARRDRPLPAEDARENGEPRAVRPVCRLLPLEESAKGPRRRKKKVKVKKKGLGQPGPAEELEGPGVGAAGGLLLPNRVGQEEPSAVGMATLHPAQGMKKKKKKKIKNKIKSRESSLEQQREEVSSTFDLYRRAMLALKMRQEQRKQPSAIAP